MHDRVKKITKWESLVFDKQKLEFNKAISNDFISGASLSEFCDGLNNAGKATLSIPDNAE